MNVLTLPELLPCPFCGGAGELQNTHTPSFWVECVECGAQAYGWDSEGPDRNERFSYSPAPRTPSEATFDDLWPEYKEAAVDACKAWNARVEQ